MAIDTTESLKRSISGLLDEAEDHELDREEVADLLEEFAETVRNGHTELEPDRGRWYQEVHGDSGVARSGTTTRAADGGNTGGRP